MPNSFDFLNLSILHHGVFAVMGTPKMTLARDDCVENGSIGPAFESLCWPFFILAAGSTV